MSGLANTRSQTLALQGAELPDAIKAAIEAVTPAKVNALAKKLFEPAHAITAVLTPESSGKAVSSKGFGSAENFASNPDHPVELPDWAKAAFAKLELPKSALHPTAYTLPNGLKLIVQPESISDTVEVYGRIKTNEDLRAPKGEEGIAQVLDGLLPFGTTSMNRLQFQAALDAISARESAGTDFSIAVPAANFAKGMTLLADNELHPALPAQAFAIVQRQTAGQVEGQLQSPAFLSELALSQALLPANDPALRHATPQNVAGLTLDKVKQYYAQTFRPDMTTIVVVGKVDPGQAKAVVEKTFSGWTAQGPKPATDYGRVPANHAGHVQTSDKSAVQDEVTMAQTIALDYDSIQRFVLTLGNQVLGDGFYASRLVRDLREKRGLVYTVGVEASLDRHRGTYSVNFGCDPGKVAEAGKPVVQNLKQMQDAPVNATELQQAKGILLRRILLGESSFGAIADNLLTYSMEGKPLDESTLAAQYYLALIADEVQQVFAKYVRPDGLVTSAKGTVPK